MTVVVISSGEKGDRLVGSLEVKVPVAGTVLVRSAQGLCQEDAKASCCTKDEGRPFEAAL